MPTGKIIDFGSSKVPKTISEAQVGKPNEQFKALERKIDDHQKNTDQKLEFFQKLLVGGIVGVTVTFIGFLLTFASFFYDTLNDNSKYEEIKEENIEIKGSIQNLKIQLDDYESEKDKILDGYTEENTVKENMEAILKTINDSKKK